MNIVDWIYPKRCVGCREEGGYVCDQCRRKIERAPGSLRYGGVVRKALKEIKYRGTYDMVKELVEIWSPQFMKEYQGAIITAVPMWRPKLRVRGFNQAELIAKELARRWGLIYEELLLRSRETKPMYGLTRVERAKNVKGAFGITNQRTNKLMNQRILLVDDVWTTGATMQECMATLKAAGARKVWPVTLAR